ncbi:MAG: hypothetical protein PUD55_01690 [Firmicutes bacterium]|nr:hypothetical protein [Bacillota bacterium]
MKKTMKFDCNDKNELMRAFVLNEHLLKPETSILRFGTKFETLVTRKNRAKVPASSVIALATGRAKLSKAGGSIGIRVADDGDCAKVTLDIKNKLEDLTAEQWEAVNCFLDDLENRGYHFDRKWA